MVGHRLMPKKIVQQARAKKTSVRLNADYLQRIATAMEAKGYNKKQRSRWVSEAICELWTQIQREAHEDIKLALDLQTLPASEGTPTPLNLTSEAVKAMDAISEYLKRHRLSYRDKQTRILCLAIEQRAFTDSAEQLVV